MIDRVRAVRTLFFVASVIPTLSGATDDALKVEVELDNVGRRTRPSTLSSHASIYCLTHDSPTWGTRQSKYRICADLAVRMVGIFENGVESQQSDGSWRACEQWWRRDVDR